MICMSEVKPGVVLENRNYLLITRETDDFVYARRVEPYIELSEEFILFTKMYMEKEFAAIDIKNIIDMNEVTRRYLEMA